MYKIYINVGNTQYYLGRKHDIDDIVDCIFGLAYDMKEYNKNHNGVFPEFSDELTARENSITHDVEELELYGLKKVKNTSISISAVKMDDDFATNDEIKVIKEIFDEINTHLIYY
jgi:L-rhamnose mutarotase